MKWGTFALTGTFDGTTFTVTDAIPAALYDALERGARAAAGHAVRAPRRRVGRRGRGQGHPRGDGRDLHRGRPVARLRRDLDGPVAGPQRHQRPHEGDHQRRRHRGRRGCRGDLARDLGRGAVREPGPLHRGRAQRDLDGAPGAARRAHHLGAADWCRPTCSTTTGRCRRGPTRSTARAASRSPPRSSRSRAEPHPGREVAAGSGSVPGVGGRRSTRTSIRLSSLEVDVVGPSRASMASDAPVVGRHRRDDAGDAPRPLAHQLGEQRRGDAAALPLVDHGHRDVGLGRLVLVADHPCHTRPAPPRGRRRSRPGPARRGRSRPPRRPGAPAWRRSGAGRPRGSGVAGSGERCS